MKSLLFSLLGVILLLLGVVAEAELQDPFQPQWSFSKAKVAAGEVVMVQVTFNVPPGHYLFDDKTDLSWEGGGEGLEWVGVERSPAVKKLDPFFKKELDILSGEVWLLGQLRVASDAAPGTVATELKLTYQGCSPELCFRQQQRTIPLRLDITAAGGQAQASSKATELRPRSLAHWLEDSLKTKGMMSYVLAFVGGVLADFTPCVIPLIPLTLAVVGVRRERKAPRNFFLSVLLVIAMSASYALLGLLAALLGYQLGFLFQNPLFLAVSALLFLILALGMFGAFELQFPLSIRNQVARWGGQGALGAVLAGLTMGILAAPCVGPIIAALLIWVAQTRDAVQGFGLLFVFGLGMGSLILVIGTFYGSLAGKLHGGRASVWIKRALGILLLVPASYYGYIAYTGFKDFQPTPVPNGSGVVWQSSFAEALALAQPPGKPLLIDFYADWCLPCVEWERGAFADPRVQQILTAHFVPLKVNCTQDTPTCAEMVERYNIIGWPTVLSTNAVGEEISGGRIVGEVYGPDKFLEFLRRVIVDSGERSE